MKTFYRIEHGVDKWLKTYYLGLYQSTTSDDMYGEGHPMPFSDQRLMVQADLVQALDSNKYIFAFPDMKRLKKWVYKREWLEDLNRLGYVLSVYECEDGYHGDTQSIFAWEKAQLKHRLNLLEV